jgi:hypothetical protein
MLIHTETSHARCAMSLHHLRHPTALGALVVLSLIGGLLDGSSAAAAPPPIGPLMQVSTDPSPFTGCTADQTPGNTGTNYPDTEIEPWVDVNPTDPDNILVGWQQDRWDNGGARGLVAGVSFDGGDNWDSVVIPGISLCSGGTFERATDPWVTFAPNGDAYFFSLSLDITTPPDRPGGFGPNAMLVSKSTDGGMTWGSPITLISDDDPRVLNDKNSITADPTDSDFVYAVWDRLTITSADAINPENISPVNPPAFGVRVGLAFKGPAYFSRTTDSGETWEPARSIYDPGANNQTIANQIVVLPDGTVIDFFTEILNFRNNDKNGRGFNFNLALIRSFDKGATFQTKPQPIRAARIFSSGTVTPDDEAPVRDGSILFDVAVDRNNGNLYAVWQDTRFRGVEEVAFAMSTDDGVTWTTPIRVNQTPANATNALRQQAFVPSVAVNDAGVLTVTYYDFRNDDPTGELTDHWAAFCSPPAEDCAVAANWGDEVRLTDDSFDILDAPIARGHFLGDYVGLATAGNDGLPVFGIADGPDQTSIFIRRILGPAM